MKDFRNAIVIGASSGIGEAIARRLGAAGTSVALVARRADELERVRSAITDAGGKALAFPHDVTRFDEVPALFDRILRALGGLDLLVYAAGLMPPIEEHEYDFAKDREILSVNLLGAMAWMNPAVATMEGQRSGTVVGISSVAGERGRRQNPAYGTSKAGLTTYLEALRNRVTRYGVDIVTIKPGFVETRMTAGMGDLLWMVKPDAVAEQTLALARSARPVSAFVPRRWGAALFVIRQIPSFVFRRLNV